MPNVSSKQNGLLQAFQETIIHCYKSVALCAKHLLSRQQAMLYSLVGSSHTLNLIELLEGKQSMDQLGQDLMVSVDHWRQVIINNIPNILLALVVLIIALLMDDRAQRAVERLVGRRNNQRELGRLLGRMARVAVLILALLFISSLFKLTTLVTSFVASLGIAGLVIAFALQDITKNFAAGVLLLLMRPFRLDDRIKVKEFEGIVTDISLRATTLRTSDGEEVLVPNADVYTSTITNLTRYERRRYHVHVIVPSTFPSEPVRQRLEAVLRQVAGLEQDPPPQVVITALSADGVEMDAQYWLLTDSKIAPQVKTQVIEGLQQVIEGLKQRAAARSTAANVEQPQL
jgi:small-conductance mechanosensitive channel